MANKTNLGQVWTPKWVVHTMLSLREKFTTCLEPSAGAAWILDFLEDTAVGVEIDSDLVTRYYETGRTNRVINCDFFDFPTTEKFDTIITNPPYVRGSNISKETRSKLPYVNGYANLYSHFLYKCIDHLNQDGELIAIVPEEIFRSTGCKELNEKMYVNGTITDVIRLAKSPFLPEVSQECVIFRYQKTVITGNYTTVTTA